MNALELNLKFFNQKKLDMNLEVYFIIILVFITKSQCEWKTAKWNDGPLNGN